jgi:hypothetical protein
MDEFQVLEDEEEGENGEENGEGEDDTSLCIAVSLFAHPLLLTQHAEQMTRRRFRLSTRAEVKAFLAYHLLISGPGRKRRDGALRWTSEENVQIVTREMATCVLVITAYPLYQYRDYQKTKHRRRPPPDPRTAPTQKRSKKRAIQEHVD